MKILKMAGGGLAYVCVATVLAQLVLVGVLWWKGALVDDRVTAMFAALHGIHPATDAPATANGAENDNSEQPSLAQIAQQRLRASLHLDLRELVADKSVTELRDLEEQVRVENERLHQLQQSLDYRLEKAQGNVVDNALLELQRTLEAMQPKQAKEQILKMLAETPDAESDAAMHDVVRILKAMSLDRRKKILSEFKTPDENDKLADILREIRHSPAELEMLQDSRSLIQQPAGATKGPATNP